QRKGRHDENPIPWNPSPRDCPRIHPGVSSGPASRADPSCHRRLFRHQGRGQLSLLRGPEKSRRATLDSLQGHAALLKRIAELEESRLAQVGGLQIVGGRYYTLRTPSGASSAKLYVRDRLNGEDHLLIDPEKLSTGQQTHLSIDGYRPSPDGRYVAYQLAAGGSEESVLHILDVQSGKDLAETADRA